MQDSSVAKRRKADAALHVLGLQMDSFMGIRVLRLNTDGKPVVEISGRNGAGKSSVLRGVEAVLAGIYPERMIRDGARKARVCLTLGMQEVPEGHREIAYTCDLAISAKGQATLTITDRDGQPIKQPRAWLKERFAAQGCDPLAFSRMPPREQIELLTRVTGLSGVFEGLERRKTAALEEARDARRAITAAEAQVEALPAVDGPDEEVSVGEMTAQLVAAQQRAARVQEGKNWIRSQRAAVETVEVEIERLRALLAEQEAKRDKLRTGLAAGEARVRELEAAASGDDIQTIQSRIANIEALNEKARRRQARARALRVLEAEQARAERAAEELAAIEVERRTAVAQAEIPVEGMTFDESGVYLNGVPIRQANTAAQLRCGVGLAVAEGKEIRVLFTEYGSMLDSASMRALAELAAEHNAQCFVEVAADGPGRGIFIEDGAEGGAA